MYCGFRMLHSALICRLHAKKSRCHGMSQRMQSVIFITRRTFPPILPRKSTPLMFKRLRKYEAVLCEARRNLKTVKLDSITPLIFNLPPIEAGWPGLFLGRFSLKKIEGRAKLNTRLREPQSHLGHIEQKNFSCIFQELNHDFSVVQSLLQTLYGIQNSRYTLWL